jgi:hypothetical protein
VKFESHPSPHASRAPFMESGWNPKPSRAKGTVGRAPSFSPAVQVHVHSLRVYSTRSPWHSGEIRTAQIKIVAAQETVEKFKRIVLAKHGKLELSAEGEEALRLYIKKYGGLLGGIVPPDQDPLKGICAIGRSVERHNVLKDLELLEAGEL